MTLLVIGASAANVARIESAASSRGLRLVIDRSWRQPAWVIVATAAQRADALTRYGLPSYRVLEMPGLDRDGSMDPGVLTRGIERMSELGAYQPVVSRAGIAIARRLMPVIAAALERVLGQDVPDSELTITAKAEKTVEKAETRAAKLRERAPKLETPEEQRRRAERKAQRKAARRAEESMVANPPGLRRTQ